MPLLRKWAYEPYLRTHQMLAVGVVFATSKHLMSIKDFTWTALIIYGSVVLALAIFYTGLTLYRNKKWGYQWPRILVRLDNEVILATMSLSRPLTVEPGQYLNLWVPSLSLLSSHPFIIASWSSNPQKSFDLIIQPRSGFTRRLYRRAEMDSAQHIAPRALFSGPHGHCVSTRGFDCVLLFATGFGVVPMLPYLKQLFHNYKERKSHTKRIHLIWQGQTIRKLVAFYLDSC